MHSLSLFYLHTHESMEKLKQGDVREIVEITEKQNPALAALSISLLFLSFIRPYIFSATLQYLHQWKCSALSVSSVLPLLFDPLTAIADFYRALQKAPHCHLILM